MGLRMSELIFILAVIGVAALVVIGLRKARKREIGSLAKDAPELDPGRDGSGSTAAQRSKPRKPYFSKRTAILAGVLLALFGGARIVNVVGEWQDERAERLANGGRTRTEIQSDKDVAEHKAAYERDQLEKGQRNAGPAGQKQTAGAEYCDPELTRQEIVAIGDRCDAEAEAEVQAMCNGSARCLERNRPEIPKLSKLCYSLRKSNKCKTWR